MKTVAKYIAGALIAMGLSQLLFNLLTRIGAGLLTRLTACILIGYCVGSATRGMVRRTR